MCFYFFFNDTATTEIYPLSLHDALPICPGGELPVRDHRAERGRGRRAGPAPGPAGGAVLVAEDHPGRSEEHTSELQSRQYLVCRLLLEKKKNQSPYVR